MADAEAELKVLIGAKLDELRAAMPSAAQIVRDTTGQMRDEFRRLSDESRGHMASLHRGIGQEVEGIAGKFETMKRTVEGVFALLAGGSLFREIVRSTQDWAFSVETLSRRLGLSTQEASAWTFAAKLAGGSADDIAASTSILVRSLNTNEDAFRRNNVQTRDAHGALLPLPEILQNAIRRYNELSVGTQQGLFATQLFKRSVGQMPELQRFVEHLAEARAEVAAFGLELGPNGVLQARAFEGTLETAKLGALGAANAFADGLKPELKAVAEEIGTLAREGKLKEWGREAGEAIQFVGETLRTIKDVIAEHWRIVVGIGAAYVAWRGATLGMAILSTVTGLVTVATTALTALADAGMVVAGVETVLTGGLNLIVPALAAATVGLVTYAGGWTKVADEARAAYRWITGAKDVIDTMSAHAAPAAGSFDIARFVKTGAMTPATLPGTTGTDNAAAPGAKGADQKAFTAIQTAMETELASVRHNAEERLAIVTRTTEAVKQRFGEESTFFAEQMKKQTQAQEAAREERTRIAQILSDTARQSATAELDLERDKVKLLQEMGAITEHDAVQRLEALAVKRHEIILAQLEDERKLYADNAVALAQIDQKSSEEQGRFATETFTIRAQEARTFAQTITQIFGAITQAVDRSIQGMIQGTLKFKDAVRNMGQAVLSEFVNLGLKIVADWLKTMTAKLLISLGVDAAILGSTVATETAKTAIEGIAAKKSITASAAEAAGKAASAVADIPYVGPILAALAYAGTYALVIGGLAAVSAKGGAGDIPADNTLAVLHAKEMVLPASIAEVVRGMATGVTGGAPRSGYVADALQSVTGVGDAGLGAGRGASATGLRQPMPVTAAKPLAVTHEGGNPIHARVTQTDGAVSTQPAPGSAPVETSPTGTQKVEVINPAGRPVFVHQIQQAGGMIAEVISMGKGYGTGGGTGGGGGGSFAGGGEVDHDMLAKVHFREMVLSPEHADKIRNLPDARDGGSRGGDSYYVYAMDSQDVERFLKKHGRAFAKSNQRIAREMNLAMPGR